MIETNTLGRTCDHADSLMHFCGQDNTYVCQRCKDKSHKFHITLPIKTLAENIQEELRYTEKKARGMSREIDLLPFTVVKDLEVVVEDLFKDIHERFAKEMTTAKEDIMHSVHELGKKILSSFRNTVDLGEIQAKITNELDKIKRLIERSDYYTVTMNFNSFNSKLQTFVELESFIDTFETLDLKDEIEDLKDELSSKFKGAIIDSKTILHKYFDNMSAKYIQSATTMGEEETTQYPTPQGNPYQQPLQKQLTPSKQLQQVQPTAQQVQMQQQVVQPFGNYQTQSFVTSQPLTQAMQIQNFLDTADKNIIEENKEDVLQLWKPPMLREYLYFLKGSRIIILDLKTMKKSAYKHNISFSSYPNFLMTKANKMYVAGGHETHQELYEFDYIKSEFVPRASMNYKRMYGHAFIEVREGYLMAIGGRGSDGVPLNSCELYDIQGDKWIQMPYLTQKRSYPTAFCINGKVAYVVGGSDTSYLNSIEKITFGENVFNPSSAWQFLQVTNLGFLTPCCVLASLVISDKQVMLFGGYNHQNNSGKSLNQCVLLDLETNEIIRPIYQLKNADNFYRNYSAYWEDKYYYISRDSHTLHIFDGTKWDCIEGLF